MTWKALGNSRACRLAAAPKDDPMLYLTLKLWPWIAAAGGVGFLTGWLSCGRGDDDDDTT